MLRCIHSGALPPALNMGLDEALLRCGGPPTLRLYGWSPPGLSLGYFQRSADFSDITGPQVLVRRLTGGGAIYHDKDLTFALTADQDLIPTALPASYALVHDAVGRALGAIGVAAHSLAHPGVGKPRPREKWCLADQGPHDLVTAAGSKILGSAQRRIDRPRPRLLHHGSIVLEAPAVTPACGAVARHNSSPDVAATLAHEVAREIAAGLGLVIEIGEPTASEWELAEELASKRYSDDSFTFRK